MTFSNFHPCLACKAPVDESEYPCMGRKNRCLDRTNLELAMSTVINSSPKFETLGKVIPLFGRLCPCFETNTNYSNFSVIIAELACDDDG